MFLKEGSGVVEKIGQPLKKRAVKTAVTFPATADQNKKSRGSNLTFDIISTAENICPKLRKRYPETSETGNGKTTDSLF
ncbi:hypothetical protein [Teredinibacter franksiae]|uniref:hypothetical protein n=1 Tax=Teredinibacter franksiae TaxID=2761453 RepID=UPI0016261F94|nr:hypothetical protein [Teredinibacter franksiae]